MAIIAAVAPIKLPAIMPTTTFAFITNTPFKQSVSSLLKTRQKTRMSANKSMVYYVIV
jgi:hypothetical protein